MRSGDYMKKVNRSLGWIQNPSSFKNLKRVISVFDKESYIYEELYNKKIYTLIKDEKLKKEMISELKKEPYILKYSLLKGKGNVKGRSRKNSECTGIIQAVIPNQKGREYSDDWTADGFLRWGIAIGFLDYNRERDEVKITMQGLKYVRETDKKNEQKILIHAFLSYPPAVRILEILETAIHCTKFELGSQLGGLGEAGFTSIPQDLYVQAIQNCEKNKIKEIRSNTEGTADKYARMICKWLEEVKLVQKIPKEIKSIIGNKEYKAEIGHSYRITLDGIRELKGAKGTSSISKIPKIVYWEMLATKVKDRDYIRNRRAFIIKFIENNISNKKIVAMGEIGLDYHYTKENKDEQIKLFEMQLSLAQKYDIPVIVHSRDATEDTINSLKKFNCKGVIHSFSGSLETARIYIKMGYMIGVNGVITFKNSKIKDVIKEVGFEHIVLETDSPYLTPEPFRGKQNNPGHVLEVAKFVANLYGISLEELAVQTNKNVTNMYKKMKLD